MPQYKKDKNEPSEMFVRSLSEGGSGDCELECGWCGRLHLCPDNEYVERDEEDRKSFKEYCESEYKRNPDGTVLHYGYDSVSAKYLNDILFVSDCPCNGLTRFENFIWNNKDTIRTYLKCRIDQEYKWAEEQHTLNKLKGI